MQNSMAVFTFFVFGWKRPFWANFQSCQKCQFKSKFGSYFNSNMQGSVMLFTFFVFDRKYRFWSNLVQIVNIVSLR